MAMVAAKDGDVRGRLRAAPPTDHQAARDQDRHVMMPITTISLVTADQLSCRLADDPIRSLLFPKSKWPGRARP
jgi:hypothetical protein